MPVTTQTITDLGVVRFMPYESFMNPNRGLNNEARVQKILDEIDEFGSGRQSVSDWPRVHTAIRRCGLFVIQASSPSFELMLRFCSEKPDAGDYEIHHRPRGGVEKGRTLRLKEVPVNETHKLVSVLTPFQVRYFIVTGANDRARTQLVWLVGLNSFTPVDETEETES